MSTWKIRHEGSPKAVEGVTTAEVVRGLQDGLWDATDEVLGPDDTTWKALENHPQFEETVLDLVPPPAPPHDDETRLDMNALIDVTLVLLIFFILTTSYAALQKMLDAPKMSADGAAGPPRVTKEQVEKFMIQVEVRMEKGAGGQETPVIKVEGQTVPQGDLVNALRKYVTGTRKIEMLLDHSPRVPHGAVVAVQDAARGAGIEQVHLLVPKEELKR